MPNRGVPDLFANVHYQRQVIGVKRPPFQWFGKFAADVDLTAFGPFYGHDFADIGDFIQSIDILKNIAAKTVLTGHAGPFSEDIAQRFEAYKQLIYERDRIVLNELKQTLSLEDFQGRNLIYRSYPPGDPLARWFELVHIEKHLQRLAELGKVRRDAGNWIRT